MHLNWSYYEPNLVFKKVFLFYQQTYVRSNSRLPSVDDGMAAQHRYTTPSNQVSASAVQFRWVVVVHKCMEWMMSDRNCDAVHSMSVKYRYKFSAYTILVTVHCYCYWRNCSARIVCMYSVYVSNECAAAWKLHGIQNCCGKLDCPGTQYNHRSTTFCDNF